MEEGYDVTFLRDAIGAESIPGYEAAVHLGYPLVGNAVLEVEEFLAAVDSSRKGGVHIEPGDIVRGSDHGEIGKVERVVEASDEIDAHLFVPGRPIIGQDLFIPVDAVVRRAGTDVFVNVPKLVMTHMPWSEPPTCAAQQAKLGPRADEIGKLYGSRSPTVEEGGHKAD